MFAIELNNLFRNSDLEKVIPRGEGAFHFRVSTFYISTAGFFINKRYSLLNRILKNIEKYSDSNAVRNIDIP